MKKTLLLVAAIFVSVLSMNAQMSLDEILESHFEAVGQDKLSEVSSIKMTGKQMAQGMELPFTMSLKRPNKMKVEASIQGSTMVQAYNGTEGYMIAPWTGSTDPQDVGEDELKQFKEQTDIDGKLYNYEKKGSTLELVGTEDMEGTEVYKLKLTEKPDKEGEEGNITYYFIDSESFVILKITAKRNFGGNEIEIDNYPGNYKQIDGIAMPYTMETKSNGNSVSQITFEEIIFNEEMPDELFEKPVKEEGK